MSILKKSSKFSSETLQIEGKMQLRYKNSKIFRLRRAKRQQRVSKSSFSILGTKKKGSRKTYTRLHLQGKVARRAIVFNNLAQIMQSCTNPAISQIRIRHMRHALNTHEHQFDKTPPNRAR